MNSICQPNLTLTSSSKHTLLIKPHFTFISHSFQTFQPRFCLCFLYLPNILIPQFKQRYIGLLMLYEFHIFEVWPQKHIFCVFGATLKQDRHYFQNDRGSPHLLCTRLANLPTNLSSVKAIQVKTEAQGSQPEYSSLVPYSLAKFHLHFYGREGGRLFITPPTQACLPPFFLSSMFTCWQSQC